MEEKNRKFVTFKPGGIYQAGDLSRLPEGKIPDCRNVLLQPGPRYEARPGFKSSYPGTATAGTWLTLARFYDRKNNTETLVACRKGTASGIYLWKTTDGVTWTEIDDGVGFANSSHIADFCTIDERLALLLSASGGNSLALSKGEPIGVDGDAHYHNEMFGAKNQIASLGVNGSTMRSFLQRVFLGRIYSAWQNELGTARYVTALSNAPGFWNYTGVSLVTSQPTSTTDLYTILPAAASGTTNFWFDAMDTEWGTPMVDTTGGGVSAVVRCDFRNRSTTTVLPITVQAVISRAMARNTGYDYLNTVRRPAAPNGYRYRLTTAGATAGSEPTWGTTIGGTTTDGTAVWTCDGSDVVGTTELILPVNSLGNWMTVFVDAVVPEAEYTWIAPKVIFGTSAYTTWPTNGLDVSLADDYANYDTRKACHGFQVTYSRYKHEFDNLTAASEAGFADGKLYRNDRIQWTEFLQFVGNVKSYPFRAQNYLDTVEVDGDIRALEVLAGRMFAFKADSTYIMSGSADPNLPLNIEGTIGEHGCLGPRAHANFGGRIYTIGDRDILAFSPGGDVEVITDEGTQEMMFARGADWVPGLSSYNRPILEIDPIKKLMFVYTQRRKIFVYSFDQKAWTTLQISKDVNGAGCEIVDMLYALDKLWISTVENGLGYLNAATLRDEVNGSVTTYPIRYYVDVPIMEMIAPKRDILIEAIDLHHQVTTSSTELEVEISRDGGNTFPQTHEVTLNTAPSSSVTQTDRIDIWQTGDSLRVRLGGLGDTGAGVFRVSSMDLITQILSGDDNTENPVTSVSASL